jgi:ribosomal protein S13
MSVLVAKTLLPERSLFFIALRRVFGLGRARGLALAEEVGVSQEMRVADVKAAQVRQVGRGAGRLRVRHGAAARAPGDSSAARPGHNDCSLSPPPLPRRKHQVTCIQAAGGQALQGWCVGACMHRPQPRPRERDLTVVQLWSAAAARLVQVVALINERYKVGDELKRAIRDDILALIAARTYRGGRHESGLPVRGQRTHTNAHTSRKFRRHLDYDVK